MISEKLANLRRSTGMALVLSAALGIVAGTQLLAQTFTFNEVEIIGNQRIEGATILNQAGIARGEPVSAARLNDALQSIQASGLFESVAIEPQGNRLVIRVEEYPTINIINFEGNDRIDDDELAPLVQSQSRRVYSPATVERDAAQIVEAYAQQGRISARVQPRIIRRSDNRVDVIFEIFEGGVVEIERIGFVGNDAFTDRRLRRVLETKQAGLLRAVIKRDTLIEDRLQFDQQLLRDFYQSRGYVDFRVSGVNSELNRERDGFIVTFNVQEGQQFRFGELTATSDLSDVDTEAFQAAINVKAGDVYSPSRVEQVIARLERLAIQEGLDFVRVEPRVTRNDRDLTLDVEFLLTRGQRIFVERIDIEGNATTLDRVVRRQFDVAEGDPFNPRQIRESAERIRALGFFSDAQVEAREGSSPQQVILDVDVTEQPTGSLSFGGSYSSDSGFGVAISFSERNFLGRGQRLSLEATGGVDNQRYSFNFVEPAFLGRDVTFGLGLSYFETDNQTGAFDTAIGKFSPSIGFPISDNGRLTLRYTLEYTDLQLNAEDGSAIGAILTAEAERGEIWDSSLGYTLSYDTRRTGLNPNAGVLLEFGQDIGGLGGDREFIRSNLRAIAQTKVLSDEVTLRATLEGGALHYSEDEGSRFTDRFLLGSSTMRGFEYGGIGPREINGGVNDALGGNFFAVARFEAEFPLGLPEEYGITGGVFYDVGSVWGLDKTNDFVVSEDFTPRHVVGVSVFWNTPIGPLRFNFSEALKKESFDEVRGFDLTISTQF